MTAPDPSAHGATTVTVSVPAGELAAFGKVMERAEESLTALRRERDDALALLAEVLAEFKHTPPGHSAESVIAVVLPERFAGWAVRLAAIRGALPDATGTVPDSPCYQPSCGPGSEWATVRPAAEGGETS